MNTFVYYEHAIKLLKDGTCLKNPAHVAQVLTTARDALIMQAMHQPDDHLDGYMDRYWLLSPTQCEAEQLPYHGIRIHHIKTPDTDRHCHNHPWEFRTFILHGGYKEELRISEHECAIKDVKVGDTYFRGENDYHRIHRISDEPLWTLCVLLKRNTKGWGFMTEKGHIDSHQYLDY